MEKRHFRKNRAIKTPKPYRRPDCKCYYIRLIGIDGKRSEINLGTADKKEARLRAKQEIDKLNQMKIKEIYKNIFMIDFGLENPIHLKINFYLSIFLLD